MENTGQKPIDKITKKGKAEKVWRLTPKVDEVLNDLKEVIKTF